MLGWACRVRGSEHLLAWEGRSSSKEQELAATCSRIPSCWVSGHVGPEDKDQVGHLETDRCMVEPQTTVLLGVAVVKPQHAGLTQVCPEGSASNSYPTQSPQA